MAQLSRSLASIRIGSDDLVPADVTKLLRCEPSQSHAKGDELVIGAGAERAARSGYWGLVADERAPGDLDSQVADLLARLPQEQAVWHELNARYSVDLFCGWFMDNLNEGITIAPQTLLALGERGVAWSIDIYGPGD